MGRKQTLANVRNGWKADITIPPIKGASRQRPHFRFAVPMALWRDVGEAVEEDDAGIELHPCLIEQRLRAGIVADSLHVTEGIHHELDRGAFPGELGGGLGREDNRYGVEQYGGRACELAVGLHGPALELQTADLGSDSEHRSAGFLDLASQLDDRRLVRAFVEQDRDLAAGHRRVALLDDRQRVGRIHIDWCLGRLVSGGKLHREARGDPLGEVLVDIAQIAEHAQPDRFDLHFRQFEGEGRGDVSLLDFGLRAEEQPRLTVMVGKRIRADAKFFGDVVAFVVGSDGGKALLALARAAVFAIVAQRIGLVIGAARGTSVCIIPSRCMFAKGQRGALIGIWWKLVVPSRDFCVSR